MDKLIYKEYYISLLQTWSRIFNEVDTILKKKTWRSKIDKKREEIRWQVNTKLDILIEENHMHQVNIDQIITKIEEIKNNKKKLLFFIRMKMKSKILTLSKGSYYNILT